MQTLIDPNNPHGWFLENTKLPIEILDLKQTLERVASPGNFIDCYEKWQVKSQALCNFMDAMEETGYVYNLQAQRAFEQKHNLPPMDENGSVLSVLVYNAQRYRRADTLVRDGWQPGSVLLPLCKGGDKIQVKGYNIIGGACVETLNIREINGEKFAMRPHKRKFAVNITGLPCKRV